MTDRELVGYHFTGDTLRDGSPIPPIGEKLVYDGEIEICDSGLHWSEHPFDALRHAPGKWLHLVECSEPVARQEGKCVSRERTILKTLDTENLCLRFAADQALSVAHLWDMPREVYRYLIAIIDGTVDTTRDAALVAAMSPAWDRASSIKAPQSYERALSTTHCVMDVTAPFVVQSAPSILMGSSRTWGGGGTWSAAKNAMHIAYLAALSVAWEERFAPRVQDIKRDEADAARAAARSDFKSKVDAAFDANQKETDK